ncbi:MAG: RagB/SusD family nutrient uptake outer membrane protein [Gemmatimonadaceae bacterium]|nr:RagB/SusD family nutrient uptake outer membrane protein [Gemmatimonadaceae bacterium]
MTIHTTIRLAAIGALCLGAVACDLEQSPVSATNQKSVFSSEAGLQLYSNSFTNVWPSVNSVFVGDDVSDYLAVRGASNYLLPSFTPNNQGGWSWTALRNINYFIESNTDPAVPEAVRNHYMGLARFSRALFYYDKVKTYGAVPWIDKPIAINDSAMLFGTRDARDVVMAKVLEDLNFAIANIRTVTSTSRTEVTQDVARAFKSRIALYEGTFRKYHANGLASGLGSSANMWLTEAATAAQQVMDGNRHSLNTSAGALGSYRSLFSSEAPPTNEVMLMYVMDVNLAVRHDANWRYTSATTGVGASFTRDFINTYLMADGTPFTDRPGYDTLSFMAEVKGRDPRLQQTIRMGDFKRLNAGTPVASPPAFTVSLTGYQPIKWTIDDIGLDAGANNTNDISIIRYGEVLLNYAEAKAELGTLTDGDWQRTVGALRARAGITGNLSRPNRVDPYLQSVYFPGISDPTILEVRRERGIELALEGLRWDDLMRWKRGELLARPWRGMYTVANRYYDLNEDGVQDVYFHTGTLPSPQIAGVNYHNITAGNSSQRTLQNGTSGLLQWQINIVRVWNDRLYLRPIAASDLVVNPKLGQNPGW